MTSAVINLPLPILLGRVVGQEWGNLALPATIVGLVCAMAIVLAATVVVMCELAWFAVKSIGSAVTTLESAPTARRAAQARTLAAFQPRQAGASPPGAAAEISGDQASTTGHPWSDLGLGIWLLGLLTLMTSIVAVPSVSHGLGGGSRARGLATLLRLVWWAVSGDGPSGCWLWVVRVVLVAFVGGGALLMAPWFRGAAQGTASTE